MDSFATPWGGFAGWAGRRRTTVGPGIFGFSQPATPPLSFPGDLIVGTERTAADAAKWSRQNNEAAITIAAGNIACTGANAALRWAGYTDETAVAIADRLAILAKIESASGNISITSGVGTPSNTGNARIGWKQGLVAANANVAPRVSVSFAAGAAGAFSELRAFNLKTLLAQKWFIVACAGQSNLVGATAVADPALDTPVEGCVVFPGAINSYVGAEFSGANALPMLAVDPINHQTLNGSSSAYGGGPCGSFLRELRKYIPADYTIVLVATSYAGQGFKANGFWNKNSANKSAYDGFWLQNRQVWSQAPSGSIMGCLLFCGGESDLGSGNIVEWNSLVTGVPALINEVRAESGWGQVPVVIMEIGMDPAVTNVADMITNQQKLRTGSGDALEFLRCEYVPRPVGWALEPAENPQTHFLQPTHRQRGIDAAQALRDIIY